MRIVREGEAVDTDALWRALEQGDGEEVERLVAADPALAAAERDGASAVLVALYWGQPEAARALAARRDGLSIFEAAALGDEAAVRAHLDRDASLARAYATDGFQPLGLAAFFGRAGVARLLLERGADPSAPSRNGMRVTPLHSAVAAGHGEIARALVEAGSDVNARQRHGWTPLHGAAERGDRDLVALLLERGADPVAANDAGMTAAGYARSKGNEALARELEAAIRH